MQRVVDFSKLVEGFLEDEESTKIAFALLPKEKRDRLLEFLGKRGALPNKGLDRFNVGDVVEIELGSDFLTEAIIVQIKAIVVDGSSWHYLFSSDELAVETVDQDIIDCAPSSCFYCHEGAWRLSIREGGFVLEVPSIVRVD